MCAFARRFQTFHISQPVYGSTNISAAPQEFIRTDRTSDMQAIGCIVAKEKMSGLIRYVPIPALPLELAVLELFPE